MRLAEKIGDKYLKLGIFLRLKQSEIQAIRADNKSVVDCIFTILTTWRDRLSNPGSTAAFKELCDAFTELGKADLVEHITRGE